jgi:hypothetical protein
MISTCPVLGAGHGDEETVCLLNSRAPPTAAVKTKHARIKGTYSTFSQIIESMLWLHLPHNKHNKASALPHT